MGDKYIQNVHTNGIKVFSADKKLFKIFRPQAVDHFSGRQVETGYTRLTEEEYNRFLKESAVFKHFIELKKLVVHDELPADAQTPHEALVSARKEVNMLRAEIDKVNAAKEALQGEMDALTVKYNELMSATGGEKLVQTEAALKDAQAKVTALTGENEDARKTITTLQNDFAELQKTYKALIDDSAKERKGRK